MATHVTHITAEDLLRMPDDGVRRELVGGELREMAPSGRTHGRVAMKFSWPLGQFVEENDLGEVYAAETGFLLATDPDTVRAPDAAYVARTRLESVPEGKGYFPGAPDLAAEVISPGDAYADVEAKVEEWLTAGCRMVVVINPRNETVKVYRSRTHVTVLTSEDTFDGEDVVPGFRLPVRRLFPQ
jgi:Uma2 family endonuclease